MPNPQLICDGNTGRAVSWNLNALGDDGVKHAASGTVSIDDYASAFISNPGLDGFQIKAKVTLLPTDPPRTVTATFNMKDTNSGIALPPLSVSVDLVPPAAPTPPPQLATHLAVVSGPGAVTASGASDPGTSTIPISVS